MTLTAVSGCGKVAVNTVLALLHVFGVRKFEFRLWPLLVLAVHVWDSGATSLSLSFFSVKWSSRIEV